MYYRLKSNIINTNNLQFDKKKLIKFWWIFTIFGQNMNLDIEKTYLFSRC